MALRAPSRKAIVAGILVSGVYPIVGNVLANQIPELRTQNALIVAIAIYVGLMALALFGQPNDVRRNSAVVADRGGEILAAQRQGWMAEARTRGILDSRIIKVPWSYDAPVGSTSESTLPIRARLRTHQVESIVSYLAKHSPWTKFVIAGEAGAGKSTALQLIAITISDQGEQFPILIKLTDWNGRRQPLARIAADTLVRQFPEAIDEATALQLIEQRYADGRLVLIMDGLDELSAESQSWIIRNVREENYRFVLSTRSDVLRNPEIGGILSNFLTFKMLPATTEEIFDYLSETIMPTARAELSVLQDAQISGNIGAANLIACLGEPLILSIFSRRLGDSIRDVASLIRSDIFDSRRRIRVYILKDLIRSASSVLTDDNDAILRSRLLAVLDPRGASNFWWTIGDRASRVTRVALAVLFGAPLGALAVFPLPLFGAVLGSTFLIIRAMRSGRLPVKWSPRSLLATPIYVLLAAALGTILSATLISTLLPQYTNLLARLLQGEILVPFWLQVVGGIALPCAHVLHSGRVLSGYRARLSIAENTVGSFFARAFAGSIILGGVSALLLAFPSAVGIGLLGAAVATSMAMTEGVTSDLDAPSPHRSFGTASTSAWGEAAVFAAIFVWGIALSLYPTLPAVDTMLTSLTLGGSIGLANSVGGSAIGRWIYVTMPYLVFGRRGPINFWKFIQDLHGLGILRYAGNSYTLGHDELARAVRSF